MNKEQKEVQQVFLDSEKETLKLLKANYKDALAEINAKIYALKGRDDEDMQNVIYQIEYQKALKTQVTAILENLHTNNFETISQYLTESYENGFIGTMYDMQKQGVPLVIPIDQKQVVEAIQHDTKLSESLYAALGKDINVLKKQISGEISRGISSSMMTSEIARNISGYADISRSKSMRIARTESHRIQCKSALDAQHKAKEKGADIVKQWDAFLDGNTRDSHRKLDGQIREIDEDFEVDGMTASAPGMFGDPAEDCNCRCALLQRARWALEDAPEATKWAEDAPVLIDDDGTTQFVDISDAKNYEQFKERYQGLAAKIGDEGIPDHEEPVLVKTIDYSNKNAVKNELQQFEKSAIKENIETACVITKDGEVFNCFGVSDRVFPDYDLKEKLKGASVTHNHPIDETSYSFSSADMQLFMEYNLEVLRGCDEVYTYEFTRNAKDIDDMVDDWFNEENYQHCWIIEHAKMYGIGYRRWKNE